MLKTFANLDPQNTKLKTFANLNATPPSNGGFARGFGNFIGDASGLKGTTEALGSTLLQPIVGNTVNNNLQQSNDLINQAKQLPQGSPERTQLLKQAADLANKTQGYAQNNLNAMPTQGQAAGSIGKLALTVGTLGGAGSGGGLAAQMGKGALIGAGFGGSQALEEGKTGKDLIAPSLIGAGVAAAIPLVSKGIEVGFSKVMPKISQWLEKSNLRLTPVQKSNLGKKLNDVTEFMSKEKIIGSPEVRTEKVANMINDSEKTYQNFLETNNTAQGISVSKQGIIDDLEKLKTASMRDNADALATGKQIDSAIENVRIQYRYEKIPISRLNQLKRTTYEGAYNKVGNKVLDSVEHDIGDIYRTSLEDATKGLQIAGKSMGEFNKNYGVMINARKLLATAQSRNQLGIFGRLVAGLVGGGISQVFGGGPIGDAVGFGFTEEAANKLATPARSLMGAGLRGASELAQSPPVRAVGNIVKRAAIPSILGK